MVTTAPRVRPPPTEGATTSPTSASLRSTVPVNGARTSVLSRLACAKRSPASADSTRAAAARTRASACAARASAPSTSCADTSSEFSARMSRSRRASRWSWSRSASASISCARAVDRLASACATWAR